MSCNSKFRFIKINSKEVSKVIGDLNIKNACQSGVIPTKIIKLHKDIITSENFNSCIDKGEVLHDLKHADTVPVHKKKSKTD